MTRADDGPRSTEPYSPARLAAELDLLRRAAGFSYRQLGRRTGCPASTLNDALNGRRFPRLDTVLAIARACGAGESAWRERWMAADPRRPPGSGADPAAVAGPPAAVPPAAPAGSPVPTPAELPHAARGFAGREDVLDRMRALGARAYTAHAPTILLIDGMAGVGKTALALQWAHQNAVGFPDGQFFVDLCGHHSRRQPVSAADALDQLLRSLGAPPGRVPSDASESARLYRSMLAGKRALIVVDDASAAEQVRPLLPASGGCVVIVTSRRRLAGLVALDGAQPLTLGALRPAESRALLVHVLGSDRVDRERDAAEELARTCGHLPLALRIAAAHLTTGSYDRIADLVDQLANGDPLVALDTEGDDDPTGVRLAFDLSYRRLNDDARRLFRRLGLVPGADVTAGMAAVLVGAGGPAVRRQLDTLHAAHLIDQRVPGRYHLHDLLRRYAAERATAEETPADRTAALCRLLDRYLRLADTAARRLYPDSLRLPLAATAGPAGAHVPPPALASEEEALTWLDTELPNLAAGVRHAARHGPYPIAWLTADALRGFFNLRLRGREWFDVANAGLDAARRDGDRPAMAAMRHSLGLAHTRLGDADAAVDHYCRALDLYRELGNAEGLAAVLICLGGAYRTRGQIGKAADAFQQALSVCRRNGLEARAAACLGDLGEMYRDQGRLAEALGCQQQALAVFRRIAIPRGEALALLAMGIAHYGLGQPDEATTCYTEALAELRAIGSRDGEAYALLCLAEVYAEAGRPDAAASHADAALALATDIGDGTLRSEAHLAMAAVRRAPTVSDLPVSDLPGARLREAGRHFDSALRFARGATYHHGEVRALVGLAGVETGLGRYDDALARCERGLALSRSHGYRLLEGQLLHTMAAAQHRAGQREQALANCRSALDIHRETGHRPGETLALDLLERLRPQAVGRRGRSDGAGGAPRGLPGGTA